MKKTSLSDLPFNESINDFGTERYVNGLIKFIENSSAPITIALQGEWGSGKTSLMTRLERALCSAPESQFIGIDINTWEYSMMSTPEATVYKILAQLVRELTKDDAASKKTFKGFLRGAGNFLYRGARESLKTIPGVGGVLAVGLEAANVPTQLSEHSEDIEPASLSDLKKALSEAVQKSIKEADKRGVIIFVDDLDRLNPPVAVEILELLKNIFTLDNCIFVLAIDYDVVVKGLKPKFGELTDKNEREFRSFFDKIIQVPFSLPVNNYRPMDFVLRSLVDIGYINSLDASNPELKALFSTVVEASVGKNPRSIKRLINTLSLLDCIAQCGSTQSDKSEDDTQDDKLLNLITVSIQICYPKIYRMLSSDSCFTSWGPEFAQKMGIKADYDSTENESGNQWERILEAACLPDAYLTQRLNDIALLLNLVIDILKKTNQADAQQLGKKMKEIMDKSSVTGINAEFKAEDLDKKRLIQQLHKNVMKRLNERRPDIDRWQLKRNTGNGGVYFWIDDDTCFDVTFTPSINAKKEIALRLWLDFYISRPDRLAGKSFDELMQEPVIADSLNKLDSVLAPLLSKRTWYFNGYTYEGCETYFPSYIDELRYLHDKGWLSDSITNNPQFWIDLKTPSQFEEDKIVDTIADVLIANYDFRKAMKGFK